MAEEYVGVSGDPSFDMDLRNEIETQREGLYEASVINPEMLQGHFVRMPGEMAYYVGLHAEALRWHLHAKAKARRLRGLLEIQTRELLEIERGHGAKNVTNDLVKAKVDQDVRWIAAETEELNAEVAEREARGRLLVMSTKRDMLIQAGAAQRLEAMRDPVIRNRIMAGNMATFEDGPNFGSPPRPQPDDDDR